MQSHHRRTTHCALTGVCFLVFAILGLCELGSLQLPSLIQHHGRVLVAINGIWDWRPNKVKTRLLHTILHNYVHACESGFEVHVVLVTYTVANTSLHTQLPLSSELFCDRLGLSLPVVVDRHNFVPIPNGTFGTGGTLAEKHRQLFVSKRFMYDIFINQEDDVFIKPHHISYFAEWSSQTARTGWYPGFTTFETLSSLSTIEEMYLRPSMIVGWRAMAAQLSYVEGRLWMKQLASPGMMMYMLTRQMLLNHTMQGWLNTTHPGGEYNPYFTCYWLQDHYTVGIPLRQVLKGVHHAPDKYINIALADSIKKRVPPRFLGINSYQLAHILTRCVGEKLFLNSRRFSNYTFNMSPHTAHPCHACLIKGKTADIRITQSLVDPNEYVHAGYNPQVNVSVTCVK